MKLFFFGKLGQNFVSLQDTKSRSNKLEISAKRNKEPKHPQNVTPTRLCVSYARREFYSPSRLSYLVNRTKLEEQGCVLDTVARKRGGRSPLDFFAVVANPRRVSRRHGGRMGWWQEATTGRKRKPNRRGDIKIVSKFIATTSNAFDPLLVSGAEQMVETNPRVSFLFFPSFLFVLTSALRFVLQLTRLAENKSHACSRMDHGGHDDRA